jgi:hypothetical protein
VRKISAMEHGGRRETIGMPHRGKRSRSSWGYKQEQRAATRLFALVSNGGWCICALGERLRIPVPHRDLLCIVTSCGGDSTHKLQTVIYELITLSVIALATWAHHDLMHAINLFH